MNQPPHVTVSGELGSGKSSVARRLADHYSLRMVSTGDIQRSIARSLNLSTLETNWLAERDNVIDSKVDQVTKDLGTGSEPIVFDSRMAWYMVPNSYKVHLLVDPLIAAKRLHSTRSSPTEQYESASHARELAEERYLSEQRRFLTTYGVDVFSLRNYHLVIDSSGANVEQVLEVILGHIEQEPVAPSRPNLYVHPRRIIPDRPTGPEDASSGSSMVRVCYSRPTFCSTGGHRAAMDAASRETLVCAELVAEGGEPVDGSGLTARNFIKRLAREPWVELWQEQFGLDCESSVR